MPLAIINAKAGQTFSGKLPLQVRLSSNRHEYGDVKLLVDGVEFGEAGDDIRPSGSSFATFIPIETVMYSNGWHDLRVQTKDQTPTHCRVKFWNDVSEFDVNEMTGPSAHVRAKSAMSVPWTVTITTILDTPETIVRVFHGHGRAISILWDGKDTQGRTVPGDMAYQVTLVAGKAAPLTSFINKM